MKKALVLLCVMVTVLVIANAAFAAERTVISVKVGVNASGAEIEKINSNGFSYFLSEAWYRIHESDLYWDYYDGYATLVGIRKHTSVYGSHPYFGTGIGLTNIFPTIDGHAGFEFRPAFLPDFLNLRAEAGMSAVFGWHGAFRPVIHFGGGVSFDFDWSIFDF